MGEVAEQIITLEAGERRFSAISCGTGSPVLCLHGFPDHASSYRHQLPALAGAGYRAVAPMLRGYEPSSQGARNVADYHPLQTAGDVVAWARELGRGEPIHLVGHDWGAIIGYLACQLEPALFRSFCSIAVPCAQALEDGLRRHPVQLRNSWYTLFFQLRGIADRVVAARDFAFIEMLWRHWSPGWAWEPGEMASLKQTFRAPGVLWSALAYYRAMLNPFLDDSKRSRRMTHRATEVPVLAVTGELDGCIDTRLFDCADAALFPKGLRTERMEGAGHFAHQERPEVFNALLLAWLSR